MFPKRSDYLSDLVSTYKHIPPSDVEKIIKEVELHHPIPKGLGYLVRSIMYHKQLYVIEERFIEYRSPLNK